MSDEKDNSDDIGDYVPKNDGSTPSEEHTENNEDLGEMFPKNDQASDNEDSDYGRMKADNRASNYTFGALGGAGATATGYGVRSAIDYGKNEIKNLINSNTPNTSDGTSSGGKWFDKVAGKGYNAPEGDSSVVEAAQKYNAQKHEGKTTSRLQKKYGKLTPESLSTPTPEAPPPAEPTFWETPAGEVMSSTGNFLKKGAKDVGLGVLHGMNLAGQTNSAIENFNNLTDSSKPISSRIGDTVEGIAHTLSGLGSGSAIASPLFQGATKEGLQAIGGPLAVLAGTGADVMGDVRHGDYRGATYSALAGAAIQFGKLYGIPPALALIYLKEHPEIEHKFIKSFSENTDLPIFP